MVKKVKKIKKPRGRSGPTFIIYLRVRITQLFKRFARVSGVEKVRARFVPSFLRHHDDDENRRVAEFEDVLRQMIAMSSSPIDLEEMVTWHAIVNKCIEVLFPSSSSNNDDNDDNAA